MMLKHSHKITFLILALAASSLLIFIQLLPEHINHVNTTTFTVGKAVLECVTIIPVATNYEGLKVIGNASKIFNTVSIGNASIDPCLWGLKRLSNTKVVSGSTTMIIRNRVLYVVTHLEFNKEVFKPWEVVGYNEVIYGVKPWGMPPSHRVPKIFAMPIKVRDLLKIHVILYSQYEIEKFDTGMNFAYDIWFKKRCLTNGVGPGDAELMIWLYRYRVKPAGFKITTIDTYALINCSIQKTFWDVYIYPRMGTGWLYIALVMKNPIPKGSIAIDLTELIVKLRGILLKNGIDLYNMYMMDIELGSELFYSRKIDVSWTLYRYMICIVPEKSILSITALKYVCS